MITVKKVNFGYEKAKTILHNINLSIQEGECILLCGESGCGKTTVTKLINGLIPHFTDNCSLEGDVCVEGMKVRETEMYILSKKIGSVFQNPKSQFFNLDSDSELVFGLENAGIPSYEIEDAFKKTVKDLKIQKLLGRNIFAMSGGEKQSLAFASVYAMSPSVFVLDEPTANLDADAIMLLREQMKKIKEQGHTIIIAEHRLYFLADLIDRAVYFEHGRIKKEFTRKDFLALTEEKRLSMGLRMLNKSECHIPMADTQGSTEGLSVENLSYSIKKKKVFNGIGFSAHAGEVIGITGNNGAGKTTLARCISGMLKPDSGIIRYNGKPLKQKQRIQSSFCVMQDVNHQLFSDSVEGECLLSDPDCPEEKIKSVLSAFDLYEYRERHPMSLSGGQKQRLAIATAVLANRPLLIFDEPTSGLDYRHMMEVKRMVRKLAENGHIILIVTHDTEFLNAACDKMFYISS